MSKMVQKEKKHLTLNVDAEIANKAVNDPNIHVSEITEKLLKAFTTSSKTADKEKLYEMYKEFFNLMLPLLKKFRVKVQIGHEEVERESEDEEDYEQVWDGPDDWHYESGIPPEIFHFYLESDGRLSHDHYDIKDIKEIPIEAFYRPQEIIDKFLEAIQKGAEYHKEQFKEIEMAKTIIDAITKGTISKSIKSKGKGGKRK